MLNVQDEVEAKPTRTDPSNRRFGAACLLDSGFG